MTNPDAESLGQCFLELGGGGFNQFPAITQNVEIHGASTEGANGLIIELSYLAT